MIKYMWKTSVVNKWHECYNNKEKALDDALQEADKYCCPGICVIITILPYDESNNIYYKVKKDSIDNKLIYKSINRG